MYMYRNDGRIRKSNPLTCSLKGSNGTSITVLNKSLFCSLHCYCVPTKSTEWCSMLAHILIRVFKNYGRVRAGGGRGGEGVGIVGMGCDGVP